VVLQRLPGGLLKGAVQHHPGKPEEQRQHQCYRRTEA
jgi:hypothetical protein